MKKHFYSHLIETSILSLELGDMDLSKEERIHLGLLIDSNIHSVILDAILSELSEKDKRIFLAHLATNDHNKIWTHLKAKIENIEEKIKKAAESIKQELHRDVKEAKRK
ncbi:MAG: hypothetical protein AAB600_01195 [Patescibacteria group bacterium]